MKGRKSSQAGQSERIRNRIREQYRQKDKQVKRSVREDKRKWMTEKAQLAQTAAENGRAKELSGRGPRKTAAVTNRKGRLLKRRKGRQDGRSN